MDWLGQNKTPKLRDSLFRVFRANDVDSSMHHNEDLTAGTLREFDRYWVRLISFDQSVNGQRAEEDIRVRVANTSRVSQSTSRTSSSDLIGSDITCPRRMLTTNMPTSRRLAYGSVNQANSVCSDDGWSTLRSMTARPMEQTNSGMGLAAQSDCDSSYPGVCIPPVSR